MPHWTTQSFFYHIYPLGFCAAPPTNDFTSDPSPRLEKIYAWLNHIQSLGANAIYLGPLFESSSHGYDTADYYRVDRRLGTNETLAHLSAEMHQRSMRLVLDGVFNHTGRNFWAFQYVLAHGERSAYSDWFANLRFGQRSPYNDPFTYEAWNGHYRLVRLNLNNPHVKEYLFGAVEMWIREFNIDGLRLDTADCLDFDFMTDLAAFCRRIRPDFWLMGEVIHGDYRRWANPHTLDSVTNYEMYKGLYSSLVDRNYFEIAYSLNRQFGPDGIYQDLPLYAFTDNHDVNRVASNLANPAYLAPLYSLLFTIPGIPSIYYGSEWGLQGKKTNFSDQALRPALNLDEISRHAPQPGLPGLITRLASIRRRSPALQRGSYRQVWVDHQQFAFLRQAGSEQIITAVNSAETPATLRLDLPQAPSAGRLPNLLNPGEIFQANNGKVVIELPPYSTRILQAHL
jgi:cyclomaltodextrinase